MAIGPFTFDDNVSQANKIAIRPALELAADTVGNLSGFKPITILTAPKDDMPDWNEAEPGIQPAWGLWKGWNRNLKRFEIQLWEKVYRSDDVVPLTLHEIKHAHHRFCMTPEIEAECMELMDPLPKSWIQGRFWARFPFETDAVHGSGALFGIKPAYIKLLDRHVAEANYPAYRAALLA